ncbi:MAG: hypothetical protein P8Y95_04920 [Gammaproteobacteria bacterium]|jgi:hypothetical protein
MVTVGTFNLNNLFSRFNFAGRVNHGGDGSDHDPAWVEIDV